MTKKQSIYAYICSYILITKTVWSWIACIVCPYLEHNHENLQRLYIFLGSDAYFWHGNYVLQIWVVEGACEASRTRCDGEAEACCEEEAFERIAWGLLSEMFFVYTNAVAVYTRKHRVHHPWKALLLLTRQITIHVHLWQSIGTIQISMSAAAVIKTSQQKEMFFSLGSFVNFL